ncbi:hypothetical protein ABVK25_010720 [Lepraria finkii]|uniref:Uncharacterized protein n=1 Tax=Lepraria finkii TaxID=1340010 RepID=A0ABR4ATM0_9LECA
MKAEKMSRTKSPSTILLEQFKGQFYHSLYVNECTLVQFANMMDNFFKEVQTATGINFQVSYNQWQTRKRAWDDDWKIKEKGGLSPEARCELDKLPIWFDSKNGVVTHTRLKIGQSIQFIKPGKGHEASQLTSHWQSCLQPHQRRIEDIWDADVPTFGFSSDTSNFDFDYTDAPQAAPLTCGTSLDTYQFSYDTHAPVEQPPPKLEQVVAPSNGVLGQYNTSGPQQANNSANPKSFDPYQPSGLEYHTTIFNENVLNYDSPTAVNYTPPFQFETTKSEFDSRNDCQTQRSTAQLRPLRPTPTAQVPFNGADLHAYTGRP